MSLIDVSVKLFGPLRDAVPDAENGQTVVQLAAGATVQDVLDKLGIDQWVMFAVNDEHDEDEGRLLQAGDRLTLFEMSAGG